MAFPDFMGSNGGGTTSNDTSHTINLPSSIGVGNIVGVIFCSDGSPTITWPAGWTALSGPTSAGGITMEARYRFADGTEGGTIVITTSTSEMSSHSTFKLANHHAITAPEGGTPSSGSSANPDPPSLDPAGWGTEDTLWLAACGYNNGTKTVTVYPTGHTSIGNDRGNHADSTGIGVSFLESAAASTDPATFTISSSDSWIGMTFAVRPVVAGGTIVAADLNATAVATPSLAAAYFASGAASMPGVATMGEVSGATKGSLLSSDGIAILLLEATDATGSFFTMVGVATVSFEGVSRTGVADLIAAGFAVVQFGGEAAEPVVSLFDAVEEVCDVPSTLLVLTQLTDGAESWVSDCEAVLIIEAEQTLAMVG